MKQYRWGIIGTGHIAGQFAKGLNSCGQAVLYAVASRTDESARSFAKAYNVSKWYGSYQELLDDPQVDAVYIATPNHLHHSLTISALKAKKAVLCEKPLGLNSSEVAEMNRVSAENKAFLMEAMWSAFLPSIRETKNAMEKGLIGMPKILKADFGIHPKYDSTSRLFNPALGGGSVYDIGIYPLFLAVYLFGYPKEVSVVSVPAPTGVDMTTLICMKHSEDRVSLLSSSFACNLKSDATIAGDKGSLRLDRMFHMPTKLYYQLEGEEQETEIPLSFTGNGYNYEADEVMRCMDENKIESDIYSHEFSQKLSDLIDEVISKSK